ncbi:MAG: ABC transporter permease [Ilumatobacter sp.]|uniref:ABC transporter permease n=1 Tax=Ilumatobacter sp. TaxID=1967498 RepID=UPI003298989C
MTDVTKGDPIADEPDDLHGTSEVVDLEPVSPGQVDAGGERRQVRRERRRLLLRSPAFVFGLVVLAFWVVCALFGDLIAPYAANPSSDLRGPARQAPSLDYLFGTDTAGRDVFSRVIYGARSILVMAPTAAIISVIAGTLLGLVMGYFRGWIDEILSRIIEALLSIPVILIALLALSVLGQSRVVVVFTVAALFTPVVTRTVRSSVLAEAQLDYVTSARLRGESALFTMTREILPNITSTIVVEFTVRVGYAVFTIATLSFLASGGVQPPTADWGLDIAETFQLIKAGQWWPSLFPALAIASLVIAVNLVADSIDRVSKL